MSAEAELTRGEELSSTIGAINATGDEASKPGDAEESIEVARGGATHGATEDSTSSSPLALSAGEEESVRSEKDEDSSSSSSGDSEFFEVEMIVGHKLVGEKHFYKIRWHKFTAKDDTWEPEENLVGSNIPQLIEQFWEEQKKKKKGKGSAKTATKKSTTPITERDHTEEEVEANDSWFGIRPDESSREARRLFVADRIMSETEKILAEVPEGVRMLRKHLRPQASGSNNNRGRKGDTSASSAPSTSLAKAKPKRKSEPTAPSSAGGSRKSAARKRKTPSAHQSGDLFTAEASPTDEVVKRERVASTEPLAEKEPKPMIDSKAASDEAKLAGDVKTASRPTIILAGRQPAPTVQAKAIPPTMKPKGALKRRDHKVESIETPSSSTATAMKKKAMLVEDALPMEPLSKGTDLAANVAKMREELTERRGVEADESKSISQQQLEEEVLEGRVEAVRRALATSKNRFDLENTDSAGKTLLHRVSELKCGSSHVQCELIDILVSAGARMDARDAKRGQIPLHHAIENRRLCHVRKLLALRSPINIPDYRDQSPIVAAFNCSDSEFVTCLLNAGATFQPVFRAKPSENKHLLKKVMNHQNRLSAALDAARAVLTKNMTFRTVSPIFVNPLHEQRSIEHGFRCDNVVLPSPHHAFVVLLALADFTSEKMEARMWGPSPLASVTVDGKECQLLAENSKFVFLCSPRQGYNVLNVELSPSCGQWDEGLKLLTQVMQMQLTTKGTGSDGRRGAGAKP